MKITTFAALANEDEATVFVFTAAETMIGSVMGTDFYIPSRDRLEAMEPGGIDTLTALSAQAKCRDPKRAQQIGAAALIEKALSKLASELAARGLRQQVEVDGEKPLFVDVEAVSAVLLHVANAVAMSAPRGETLVVRVDCARPGSTMIRISDCGSTAGAPREPELAGKRVKTDLCRQALSSTGGGLSRIVRPDGGLVHWVSLPDRSPSDRRSSYCIQRDSDRRRHDAGPNPAIGERRSGR